MAVTGMRRRIQRLRARTTGQSLGVAGLVIAMILITIAIVGDLLATHDPRSINVGPALESPNINHLMGTDELGRDIFSRVVSGLRVSLLVGAAAAAGTFLIGVIIGGVAGYVGGKVDNVLMRLTEAIQSIPLFFLALTLVALFGPTTGNVILTIALLGWPIIARVARSEFIALKTRQYVDAARVSGMRPMGLILKEILPNALASLTVTTTVFVGDAILIEAALSYVGLGDPAGVSLGRIIYDAQGIMSIAWWAVVFPGMVLALAILSANLIGDLLARLADPRGDSQPSTIRRSPRRLRRAG